MCVVLRQNVVDKTWLRQNVVGQNVVEKTGKRQNVVEQNVVGQNADRQNMVGKNAERPNVVGIITALFIPTLSVTPRVFFKFVMRDHSPDFKDRYKKVLKWKRYVLKT